MYESFRLRPKCFIAAKMTLLTQAQPQTHSAESHQFTRSPFHLIHSPCLHVVFHKDKLIFSTVLFLVYGESYYHALMFVFRLSLTLNRNTVIHKNWSMVQRLGVTGLKSGFQLTYTC